MLRRRIASRRDMRAHMATRPWCHGRAASPLRAGLVARQTATPRRRPRRPCCCCRCAAAALQATPPGLAEAGAVGERGRSQLRPLECCMCWQLPARCLLGAGPRCIGAFFIYFLCACSRSVAQKFSPECPVTKPPASLLPLHAFVGRGGAIELEFLVFGWFLSVL